MAVHIFTYLHLLEGFYYLLPLNQTQINCEYPPHNYPTDTLDTLVK